MSRPRSPQPSRPASGRAHARRNARRILRGLLLVSLAGMLVFCLYVLYLSRTLPDVHTVLEKPIRPIETSLILASDGEVIMSYGRYAHFPMPLSEISPNVRKAVLSTEDRRFYDHHGIDPVGILRAVFQNIGAGGIREGASTLSQQLARTLFLNNERSFVRKIKEAYLAVRLEKALDKEKILQLYLNNVYFGEGAYGIEAASRVYFNKPAKKLSVSEAAMLAGLVQAPSQYDPYEHPEAAKKRRDQVLKNMVASGELKEKDIKPYLGSSFKLGGRALSEPNKAPFFNRYVLNSIIGKLAQNEEEFWKGGYRVHTTLSFRAQKIAEGQIKKVAYFTGRGNQEGALLSLDAGNRIVAYVGGRDFNKNQYDHVTQAHRPAGSLLKPLIYATAIENGLSPFKIFIDRPIRFGNWMPQNYDRSYHGPMNLVQALVKSNNVIAVQVLNQITPELFVQKLGQFGFESDKIRPNLTLALGATEVTLEELTGAYSVFRNDGQYRQPYAVEKILDRNDEEIYTYQGQATTVLNRNTRDTMVAMMRGVLVYGTGKGAAFGRDAAAKTGTSDNYRDAWFVGYTPEATTGIWLGTDDNTKMVGVTGGTIPATIWKNYMAAYLKPNMQKRFDLAYAPNITKQDFMGYQSPVLIAEQYPVGYAPRVLANGFTALPGESQEMASARTEAKESWAKFKQGFKNSWKALKSKFKD